jgi:hypothetical protein
MFSQIITALLALAAFLLFVLSVLFAFAAMWELILGRRPPGFLGWEILSRGPRRTDTWSSAKWRLSGYILFGMGGGLFILSLVLLIAALRHAGLVVG